MVAALDRRGQGGLEGLPDPEAGMVQVIIDFSSPELLGDVVEWCEKRGVPLVSGTTGLTESDFSRMKKAAEKIPILWAPNMSLGIAVLNELIKGLSVVKEQFDFQIEEFHHIHKKDRPSGTALFLQNTLESEVGETVEPPIVIRGGGIFGDHKVWAMGQEETLCLQHTALNRRVFARGAIQAAKWLVNQSPGSYSMKDVISI
jgi:4-hydroxy-tetrahydrodipicolinate reductase